MVGWLVFGTLGAVLAAELYFMFKKEEEQQQEEECKCNCGCCNQEKIDLLDSLQNLTEEDVSAKIEENEEE